MILIEYHAKLLPFHDYHKLNKSKNNTTYHDCVLSLLVNNKHVK